MNCESTYVSISDLTDQNSEATTEQAILGSCMQVEPRLTGKLFSQEDYGPKRKHCEISADTEVGGKKFRFQGDDKNVIACDTKERKCEFAHVLPKLSDTLKASFLHESELTNLNAKSNNDISGNLPEEAKKGRRRKRGQGKNKVNEKLIETQKALQQTNMDSRLAENDAQETLTSQEVDINITKTEERLSTMSSVGSKPFLKLTEKPSPKADNVACKHSLSQSKLQEIPGLQGNPKHAEKQLNNRNVTKNSIFREIKSEETKSKPVPKPRHSEQIFMYGNYSRYYGYRSPELEEDERLDCFTQSFFKGKEVLDIGCNIGHATYLIARDWRPKRIVGLDIDGKLINIAKKNVKHYLGKSVQEKLHNSALNSFGEEAALNNSRNLIAAVKSDDLFPNNVMFMQGNYVLERDDLVALQKEEYDVILALSVSKWIHLNFGDDGLKRTFQRVFRQLRPGGKFILEPQEWSSYKKRKKLTETIYENFKNIKFRPDSFRNYLLSDDVGFSSCELLGIPKNKSKGFRRPLLMFSKSSSQNHLKSLGETEQQNSATNEDHSEMNCSLGSIKTENAIINSGEEQSTSSQHFSEVVCVQENTENTFYSTLNMTDSVTTTDATSGDRAVSTCSTVSVKTEMKAEDVIIKPDEEQSPSLQDVAEVATHIQDNTESSGNTLNMTNTVTTTDATSGDHSVSSGSTVSIKTEMKTEDVTIKPDEEQSPSLRAVIEVATHIQDNTENTGNTLNVTDTVTIKTEMKTEDAIIRSGGEQSPHLGDVVEAAAHIPDVAGNIPTALNITCTPTANGATNEDHFTSACLTDSTKAADVIVKHDEGFEVSAGANDVAACDASLA